MYINALFVFFNGLLRLNFVGLVAVAILDVKGATIRHHPIIPPPQKKKNNATVQYYRSIQHAVNNLLLNHLYYINDVCILF